MTRLTPFVLVAILVASTHVIAQDAPAPDPEKKLDPAHMKSLAEALGAKPGDTRGRVHTLTLPRDDLDVSTLDAGEVPTEAGLASTLRLWRCGCGKYYVVGEFCVVDYESNDVIDALRAGGHVSIVSVGPMLLQEKPRILMIRLQGEGDIDTLTKTFKEAVRWIGENRTKRNPIK